MMPETTVRVVSVQEGRSEYRSEDVYVITFEMSSNGHEMLSIQREVPSHVGIEEAIRIARSYVARIFEHGAKISQEWKIPEDEVRRLLGQE